MSADSYEIEAEDGKMPVFVARPAGSGSYPGIIVLMEAYGLNDHIRSLARRTAEEGFVAVSPDLYYRQPVRTAAYDDLTTTVALATSLWDTKVLLDTRAAVDHLRSLGGVRGDGVGVAGFSMGGRIALLMASHHREIAAAAIFYGGLIPGQRGPQSINALETVRFVKCPIIGNFAELDEFVPGAEVEQLERCFAAAGKPFDLKVYPSARHSFMDETRPAHNAEAADDAWARTMKFFSRHLG